ncbi:MAG: SAF domain-containing protein [Pseudomonadota bacterium]
MLAEDIALGAGAALGGKVFKVPCDLTMGHKIAIRNIPEGCDIIKYGAPIGFAACEIEAGEHVHLHNIKSRYTAITDIEADRP